jgi:truncated hemoglobin YjbI
MFERWLALWHTATEATMPPEDAARLQARAAAIAQARAPSRHRDKGA